MVVCYFYSDYEHLDKVSGMSYDECVAEQKRTNQVDIYSLKSFESLFNEGYISDLGMIRIFEVAKCCY